LLTKPLPGLPSGSHVGQQLGFAMRLAQPVLSERGRCEVHLPEVYMVLYEPLVVALHGIFMSRLPTPSQSRSRVRNSKIDRVESSYELRRLVSRFSIGTRQRTHYIPIGEQQNIFSEAGRTRVHAAEKKAKLFDAIKEQQRLFERLVGLSKVSLTWDLDVWAQATHVMSLQCYSNAKVLVGDIWTRPLIYRMYDGKMDPPQLWDVAAEDGADVPLISPELAQKNRSIVVNVGELDKSQWQVSFNVLPHEQVCGKLRAARGQWRSEHHPDDGEVELRRTDLGPSSLPPPIELWGSPELNFSTLPLMPPRLLGRPESPQSPGRLYL